MRANIKPCEPLIQFTWDCATIISDELHVDPLAILGRSKNRRLVEARRQLLVVLLRYTAYWASHGAVNSSVAISRDASEMRERGAQTLSVSIVARLFGQDHSSIVRTFQLPIRLNARAAERAANLVPDHPLPCFPIVFVPAKDAVDWSVYSIMAERLNQKKTEAI